MEGLNIKPVSMSSARIFSEQDGAYARRMRCRNAMVEAGAYAHVTPRAEPDKLHPLLRSGEVRMSFAVASEVIAEGTGGQLIPEAELTGAQSRILMVVRLILMHVIDYINAQHADDPRTVAINRGFTGHVFIVKANTEYYAAFYPTLGIMLINSFYASDNYFADEDVVSLVEMVMHELAHCVGSGHDEYWRDTFLWLLNISARSEVVGVRPMLTCRNCQFYGICDQGMCPNCNWIHDPCECPDPMGVAGASPNPAGIWTMRRDATTASAASAAGAPAPAPAVPVPAPVPAPAPSPASPPQPPVAQPGRLEVMQNLIRDMQRR